MRHNADEYYHIRAHPFAPVAPLDRKVWRNMPDRAGYVNHEAKAVISYSEAAKAGFLPESAEEREKRVLEQRLEDIEHMMEIWTRVGLRLLRAVGAVDSTNENAFPIDIACDEAVKIIEAARDMIAKENGPATPPLQKM